jgi:hypothetical protein
MEFRTADAVTPTLAITNQGAEVTPASERDFLGAGEPQCGGSDGSMKNCAFGS